MKRFALVITVLGALTVFGSDSVNAADNHHGHGYVGHTSYAHGYAGYGHSLRQVYVGHGYVAPVYGHGLVRHGYVRHGYVQHGYVAPTHGGHVSYRSYGHGGGVRISTPHFGLQIGH